MPTSFAWDRPHLIAMVDTGSRSRRAVQLLTGRWTLPVLAELADGGRRYQDLHDGIESIAHKVLTDTLRKAERDGLITRHLDAKHIETATLYDYAACVIMPTRSVAVAG